MKTTPNKLNIFLFVALALSFTACSDSNLGPSTQRPQDLWGIFATSDIVVLGADMQPLENAKILIGAEEGSLPGNFIATDASGRAALPAAWINAEPVTIDAPGYVRATYYAQMPGAHHYQLRKKTGMSQYEVSGITQGHNVVDKDDFIDFGLVIPALTRNDLMAFDLAAVISTQMDTISILGQTVEIPSNVTLPRQRESYILPVTIEKPGYRLYFTDPGIKKVYAARGRFPFETVVDRLRAKAEFHELINYFTISGGGVKDINVAKSTTQVNLSVKDLNFTSKARISAPNIASDEMMLAVTTAEMGEYLVPTDVKSFKAGERRDLATLDQNSVLVGILKKTNEIDSNAPGADRLSAVMIPAANAAPQFLPLLEAPSLASNGDMLVPKANLIRGVNAVATYSVVSQQVEVLQGKDKVIMKKPYWEVYAPYWLDVVSLPRWPEASKRAAGKKIWEVNLIGSLKASQVDLGPAMLNEATHVTHTSLDL